MLVASRQINDLVSFELNHRIFEVVALACETQSATHGENIVSGDWTKLASSGRLQKASYFFPSRRTLDELGQFMNVHALLGHGNDVRTGGLQLQYHCQPTPRWSNLWTIFPQQPHSGMLHPQQNNETTVDLTVISDEQSSCIFVNVSIRNCEVW